MFNWLFPSRYTNLGEQPLSYGPPKCSHRGTMYSAWDVVASWDKYRTDAKGEKDILSVSRLEKCNRCGEHRLVTYDLKVGTVTITKQIVVDPDVA